MKVYVLEEDKTHLDQSDTGLPTLTLLFENLDVRSTYMLLNRQYRLTESTRTWINSQNNQLYGIPECNIDERAQVVAQTAGNTFCCMAQQPRQGDNSDCVHGKDDRRA